MRCQITSVPRVGTVQPYSVKAARRRRHRPCMAYPPVTSALLHPAVPFIRLLPHYYRECKCKWLWDSDIHSHNRRICCIPSIARRRLLISVIAVAVAVYSPLPPSPPPSPTLRLLKMMRQGANSRSHLRSLTSSARGNRYTPSDQDRIKQLQDSSKKGLCKVRMKKVLQMFCCSLEVAKVMHCHICK